MAAAIAALLSPTVASACSQWWLGERIAVRQQNWITVTIDRIEQTGSDFTGLGRYMERLSVSDQFPKGGHRERLGQVRGTTDGDTINFTIDWTRLSGDRAKFVGHYTGTISRHGRAEGLTYVRGLDGSNFRWYSGRLSCPSSAPVPPLRLPDPPTVEDAMRDTGPIAGAAPRPVSREAGMTAPPGPYTSPPATSRRQGAGAAAATGGFANAAGAGAKGTIAEPYGAIGVKFYALGAAGGPLGPHTGSETDAPHGGRCQHFRHGMVCWHRDIGEAFAVQGMIYAKWAAVGRTQFGYPITDERVTADGRGRYNHFRSMQSPRRPESSIYWTPQTGAHAIFGAIRDAWAAQGWEAGPLGYPTSDEHQDGKFRRVNFERGHVLWAPDTGIQVVR